jgi:hypothetical protein
VARFASALLDDLAAGAIRDAETEYAALRRVVLAAPNSEWMYKLAAAAANTGRYVEADSLMSALDPDAGWMRDWEMYWYLLPSVKYWVGRHADEVEAARRGTDRTHSGWLYPYDGGRGLAALGKDREVISLMNADFARVQRHASSSDWLMVLSAARLHGQLELARVIAKRLLKTPITTQEDFGTDSVVARARFDVLALEHAELWDEAERGARRLLHVDSIAGRHDALPYMVLLQAALRRNPVGDTVGLETRAIEEAAKWDWHSQGTWMVDTPPMVRAEIAAIHHDARKAAAMLDDADEHGLYLIYWLTERPAFDPIRGDPAVPWIHDPSADRGAAQAMFAR